MSICLILTDCPLQTKRHLLAQFCVSKAGMVWHGLAWSKFNSANIALHKIAYAGVIPPGYNEMEMTPREKLAQFVPAVAMGTSF